MSFEQIAVASHVSGWLPVQVTELQIAFAAFEKPEFV